MSNSLQRLLGKAPESNTGIGHVMSDIRYGYDYSRYRARTGSTFLPGKIVTLKRPELEHVVT